MVGLILGLIVLLWLAGFIQIPFLNAVLFSISSHPFSLRSLLFLLLIVWVLSLLPGVFRLIVGVLLVLWLLSVFGVFAMGGLSQILIVILIVVLVFSIF